MVGKFNLGKPLMTRGVNDLVASNGKFAKFVLKSLNRHIYGDWGDLCEEDKKLNDYALASGEDRIFSKYKFDEDTAIYIITEYDRSYTTILFLEEY